MRNYGRYGRELETFRLYEAFRDNPRLQEKMSEIGLLQEGTGAPEGRADFPVFLQTMIRYRLRERFRTVASKWRQYVGIENAKDFREHRTHQLNGIRGIEPINEFGEYKRMRSAEELGPPFAIGKHGGIYALTLEMIVNDEADRMLNRIPRELGRHAAEYVSQVVVALFESNPNYIDGDPFFSAARGNEVTGADAEPTETNLVKILSQMRLRRDSDNIPFTVEPRRIVTKSDETRLLFRQILRSQQTGITNNDIDAREFGRGTMNPLYDDGILPGDAVIQEVWLQDAENWTVLGDADDRPAFVAAFLNNQQEPFVGVQDSGVRSVGGGGRDPYMLDIDEIPFKVRHLFGVAVGEPLAAFRARPT